jgi:FMN-dependent NADH-azoreductase
MKLLQIDSSPMGEMALSRRLTQEFARRWLAANPHGSVTERDLTKTTIPVIDAEWVAANYVEPDLRTDRQNEALRMSRAFIGELLEADEYVMGVPMHNWGPPASFKLWVDQIVTASSGTERPLAGTRISLAEKRASFIVVAGGRYDAESATAAKDLLSPWLLTLFGSLGVKDMRLVRVDRTRDVNNGTLDREAFLAPHLEAIKALFD